MEVILTNCFVKSCDSTWHAVNRRSVSKNHSSLQLVVYKPRKSLADFLDGVSKLSTTAASVYLARCEHIQLQLVFVAFAFLYCLLFLEVFVTVQWLWGIWSRFRSFLDYFLSFFWPMEPLADQRWINERTVVFTRMAEGHILRAIANSCSRTLCMTSVLRRQNVCFRIAKDVFGVVRIAILQMNCEWWCRNFGCTFKPRFAHILNNESAGMKRWQSMTILTYWRKQWREI